MESGNDRIPRIIGHDFPHLTPIIFSGTLRMTVKKWPLGDPDAPNRCTSK
jgi:hypothetical protein